VVEDPRRRAADRLHAIVVGSNAVDEVKRVCAIFLVDGFTLQSCWKSLRLIQSARFFSIFP
jgi:hypothetical protein